MSSAAAMVLPISKVVAELHPEGRDISEEASLILQMDDRDRQR